MVKFPSLTPLFADTFDGHISPDNSLAHWAGTDPYSYIADAAFGYNAPLGLSNRHSGGVNLCFFDGHAKWFRIETVLNEQAWSGDPLPTPPTSIWELLAVTNYNKAGLVWDIDGPNRYTAPGKYSTFCCSTNPQY